MRFCEVRERNPHTHIGAPRFQVSSVKAKPGSETCNASFAASLTSVLPDNSVCKCSIAPRVGPSVGDIGRAHDITGASGDDLFHRPTVAARVIDMQDQVVMITHHSVRGDVDRKDVAEQFLAIEEPGLAVVEISALLIDTKKNDRRTQRVMQ